MTVKEMYDKCAEIIANGKGDYQIVVPEDGGTENTLEVNENYQYVYIRSYL